jgi:hypothetical protein
MLEVQRRKLEEITRTLALLGTKYKVITPCGLEYGDLEVKENRVLKTARDLPRYNRLETRDFFLPYLKDMKAGEAKVINCGKYDPRVISRDISSYCANAMGAGSVSCLTDFGGGAVQVLALQDLR